MKIGFVLLCWTLFLFGCGSFKKTAVTHTTADHPLYAAEGKEYLVRFQALFRSQYRSLDEVETDAVYFDAREATRFLFGPLTLRQIGGIQKGDRVQPLFDKAYMENGTVTIPYSYEGTWMINTNILPPSKTLQLPVPYSVGLLKTPQWQNCTDMSDEEHSTWSFFWYFWDPERPGCDHQASRQYQIVQAQLMDETPQTKLSFPEYKNLIHSENGVPVLAMTFAFGYVNEPENPHPFQDADFGMQEFRDFYQRAKVKLISEGFQEQLLRQSDITEGDTVIGVQFTGVRLGVQVRVSILAAAGVDQMYIFADRFAKKHEGFFGWFGHSRVGTGFDAGILKDKLILYPQEFSISPEYQLVYWGGCNSYSYYTLPFFELKAQADPQNDPKGTRKLDLISNTLPSMFALNAANADILLQALMSWEKPTSYQRIIQQIEGVANSFGTTVIANVLGDEDNT